MRALPNTVEQGAVHADKIVSALILGSIDMTVQETAERIPPFKAPTSR
jgi:hypothetical protein